MIPPVLLLLLMLGVQAEVGAHSDSRCSDGDPYNQISEVNISYSNETGFDIHIPKCGLHVIINFSSLDCTWNNTPCYAWCFDGSKSAINLNVSTHVSFYDNCRGFCVHGTNLSCFTRLCTKALTVLQIHEHENASLEDLKRILNIKRICHSVLNDLAEYYMRVEEYIIHNVMRDTSITNSSVEHDLDDIVMTIISRNCSKQGSFINATYQMMVPELVPVVTLVPLEAFDHTTEDRKKAAVVQYRSPQQFLMNQKIHLVSPVVRVEVLDKPSKPLKTLLNMTFTVKGNDWIKLSNLSKEYNHFSCQFYNVAGFTKLHWKSSGCVESIVSSEDPYNTVVQCLCDHMTPFAVLLIPGLEKQLGQHWTILSYLSYIGCGLSALFSALSILTYYILRKVQTDVSAAIHMSLSGALLLLNSTFLMSEWATSQDILCVCVAVAIEYSLLSTFTWMAIEALHLYLMLIRVFNTYYRHYMLKLSLVGWGLPALLVSLSMVVKQENDSIVYGPVGTDLQYCWIKESLLAYGLNVTFFILVFVMNAGVLGTVSGRILQLRRGRPPVMAESGARLTCRNLLTVLGLTCLLGLTWALAFLSYGYINITILYLFCILNSLQGFFLFLWVYGTARKRRREQQSDTHTHTSNVLNSFSTSRSKEELFTTPKLSS